ncbi:hypothetical protein AQUCO_06200023v1 [Aquilegia coerulea]|uniref:HAT C-terminal dimerisation domain-containing protein n=1 Tax=Aquilegia coerulea TaxID=218851 RepID=A0A2G5CCZ5_AQUCA|nr:hypothetical protein AQUCO_06200023v1 [Aquilegia coerulea]
MGSVIGDNSGLDDVELLDSGTPPTVGKKRKGSLCWTQFTKIDSKNEDGTQMKNKDGVDINLAEYKICGGKLKYGGTNGTSHLNRHMSSCIKRTSDVQQTIIGRTPTGGIFSFTFSQMEVPFMKVEKPAFRRWMRKAFGPQFKPPCRATIRNNVMQIFEQEKTVLKDLLQNIPGKICLTSDMWTSNQKLGYLCITAHFITKDWKLHKRVISFPMLPSPHTGKIIGEAMYANLLNWNICDKIGTVTLDNASNNDSAVARLKDSLFENDFLCRELFHLRCSAHVINLLVKDGLEHVLPSLENIRESVRHIKSSQAKLQSFFACCERLNMKKSLTDWNHATVIRDFFKIFYVSTRLFSGVHYVTSSSFCYQMSKIACILKTIADVPSFKLMYNDMKLKYDKYWKSVPMALGLASIMDPRYKLQVLELCLELNYESEFYSDKLFDVFEVYQKKLNNNVVGPSNATPNRREASYETSKSELHRYLDQPPLMIPQESAFDILDWWRTQKASYPALSAMARDLLTIPVSTVASESAFSGSERVVSKYRSCLLPNVVEALTCLNDWFQAEEGTQDEEANDYLIILLRSTNILSKGI